MRIRILIRGLLYENIDRRIIVDPILNSPNQFHKNCMAERKENYQWDLEIEKVKN